ncbi:hypothetical protein ATCC90586_008259 [Pythium insidiosum]|nr:hypothetical protein ATCC90586_008259 [Pythium insidiosum]
MSMKLIPLGGGNEALCHFLNFGGVDMLLDCGGGRRDDQGVIDLPSLDAVDVASLDVVLLSNHTSVLALPHLVEHLGFQGAIYATEMTLQFGRLLLRELAQQGDGEASLRYAERPSDPNAKQTSVAVSLAQAECALRRVTAVEYRETVRLAYGVQLTALSSGFSLGACLWSLESPSERLAYVAAASGDLNRHPKELDLAPLVDCDALIVTDIRPNRDPHGTVERAVEHVVGLVQRVLDRGGVCVVPSPPLGVVLDLIEALHVSSLSRPSRPHPTPIVLLSPSAEEALDAANCGAEWLCDKKVQALYAGESAFLHEALRRSRALEVATAISGRLLSGLQHGGVVFASQGVLPDLLQIVGHDVRNAVLSIDPATSHNASSAVAPFHALELEKLVCPIDARLSCGDVNQLIARCLPRALVVPHEYLSPATAVTSESGEPSHFAHVFPLHELIPAKPKTELVTLPLRHLEPVTLDRSAKYIEGKLSPELAARAIMTEIHGRGVAALSGVVTVRNNEFVVETAPRGTDIDGSAHVDRLGGRPTSSSGADVNGADTPQSRSQTTGSKRKAATAFAPSASPMASVLKSGYTLEYREGSNIVLGTVDEDKLVKHLEAHNPNMEVYVSQGPGDADAMLSIPSLDARITLWKDGARTLIETATEETRRVLQGIVLAQLHTIPA